jgi:hypothetical protein
MSNPAKFWSYFHVVILAVFATPFSQPLFLVFRAHAFQTAKQCVFLKKFLYESCLKNQINPFLKKKIANT